jgi:PAS domain-containing protein
VDISERKRTENALRESERKYRELADQLDEALRKKGESRRKIGQILIDNGLATELDIAEGLAEQFGFRLVDPRRVRPTRRALELLTEDQDQEEAAVVRFWCTREQIRKLAREVLGGKHRS